jgi:hypothetical protein
VIGLEDDGIEIIFDSLKNNNSLIHLGIENKKRGYLE